MKIKILLFLFFCFLKTSAQQTAVDSLIHKKFNYKSFVLPTVLIGYGLISLNDPTLQSIDASIQKKFNPANHTKLDEATMFLPTLSVYGLNLTGLKGKHDFKNSTLIISTATIIALGSTTGLKAMSQRERPNQLSNHSFPSRHTALAFMGAEFLYQEYKHISPWYGIAGYGLAATTAYLRVYNNKHWFSDVVAGAGFGIVSTKIAYLLHPYLQNKIFKNKTSTAFVNPFYNGEQKGVSFVKNF